MTGVFYRKTGTGSGEGQAARTAFTCGCYGHPCPCARSDTRIRLRYSGCRLHSGRGVDGNRKGTHGHTFAKLIGMTFMP
jgi:hypothetical protein